MFELKVSAPLRASGDNSTAREAINALICMRSTALRQLLWRRLLACICSRQTSASLRAAKCRPLVDCDGSGAWRRRTVRSAHSLWWSVRRNAASGRFMSLTPRVDVTNGLCTCGSHLNNHNADIEGSSGFNLSQNRRMFSRGFSVVAAETALFEGHMYIITHILNT